MSETAINTQHYDDCIAIGVTPQGWVAYNLHNAIWQLPLPSPIAPNFISNNRTSEGVFVCLYPINQHLLNLYFSLKTNPKPNT